MRTFPLFSSVLLFFFHPLFFLLSSLHVLSIHVVIGNVQEIEVINGYLFLLSEGWRSDQGFYILVVQDFLLQEIICQLHEHKKIKINEQLSFNHIIINNYNMIYAAQLQLSSIITQHVCVC